MLLVALALFQADPSLAAMDVARARPAEARVATIQRLDADLIDWFKDQAGGRGYRAWTNRVLRGHVTRAAGSARIK